MRISDWSSDVCSSDLLLHLAVLDSGTITGPEGWTNIISPSSVNIYTAKIANGTECGTSATINKTSTSTTAASQIIRLSNWSGNLADIENVASSTLTNTAIFNPPNLAPSYGAGATLWIAACWAQFAGSPITTYPGA